MNQQDSATSNPRPKTREDDIQKAEATRRAAESSRAVAEVSRESAEARRERAERERISAEDLRKTAEVDRRVAEEHRRSAEELRQAVKQTHAAAEELRAAAEEAKSVLEEAKQGQQNGGDGMGLQLQMEQMPGYLAARFIGSVVPGEPSQQFELIAEHCKRTKNNKLLIDTTRLDVKTTITSRFFGAKRLRIFARSRIKVAFVSRPEQLDPRRFVILVAQNPGVTVATFTDFQSAEEWLLK
jgi:hypothetical protein